MNVDLDDDEVPLTAEDGVPSAAKAAPAPVRETAANKQRCHTSVLGIVALFLLLCVTASVYRPFRASWPDIVTATKIMSPVGPTHVDGEYTSRCSSPCLFFTATYVTPPQAAAWRFASNHSVCPSVPEAQKTLAMIACDRAGVRGVSVFYTCMNQPYRVVRPRHSGGKPAIYLNSHLLVESLESTTIEPLFLAYAALPGLLAMGVSEEESLRKVLGLFDAGALPSSHPLPWDGRDMIEAAAMQLLCFEPSAAGEGALAAGMGCNDKATTQSPRLRGSRW